MLKLMKSLSNFKPAGKMINIILLIVVIIALALSFYFYSQYQKSQKVLNSQAAAKEQITDTVNKVGQLIELPSSETPELATVTDINKLKSQPFFANAKNGDKVLIFKNAKKIILYRPSINKIIEVSPLNLGNSISQPSTITPTPSLSPTPNVATKVYNVALYNGSQTTGLTVKVAAKLAAASKDFTVTVRKDADKSDYKTSLVVDLTNSNKDAATKLAGLLNAKVGTLPNGETKPQNVDFLVILAGE